MPKARRDDLPQFGEVTDGVEDLGNASASRLCQLQTANAAP
jgi:hypothetical protein